MQLPPAVAQTYLARVGNWRLPVLVGVVSTPFLRRDGSICETPGYDAQSGMLLRPHTVFPPIPTEPTRDDALKAIAKLREPIKYFPFVTKADESVFLASVLTALDRAAMATAPMFGFNAPAAGSKSLLVDLVSMVARGAPAPVINQGPKEEELEKRLGASLLQGDSLISIDNCAHPIAS